MRRYGCRYVAGVKGRGKPRQGKASIGHGVLGEGGSGILKSFGRSSHIVIQPNGRCLIIHATQSSQSMQAFGPSKSSPTFNFKFGQARI